MCPEFGGPWTQTKLECVRKYMHAYRQALKNQPFELEYVDGFAGNGELALPALPSAQEAVLFDTEIRDASEYRAGSAKLALEVEPAFHRYLFVETRAKNVRQLDELCAAYPDRASSCRVVRGDANEVITEYCRGPWAGRRALVFLDPFGAQVEWPTVEALGATKAVDLWYLFPLSGVLRMARKDGSIPDDWADRLDTLFGTRQWAEEFYRPSHQLSLFDGEPAGLERTINPDRLRQFIMGRVQTVFYAVSPNSRILYGSKGSPLFLLVFAAANEAGAELALKIANHVLAR